MEELYHVKQSKTNPAVGMPDEKHLCVQTEENHIFYYQCIEHHSTLHPKCYVKSSPLPSDPSLLGPARSWPRTHFSIQMSRKQLQ